MKRNLYFLLFTLIIGAALFSTTNAQNLKVTAYEVKSESKEYAEYFGGELYVTVDGKQIKIADQANDVWITNDGKEVVYSGRDGAGGYENEGHSLRVYDVNTRETRKVMAEYTSVLGMSEVKLSNGARALLVRLVDGGLGASYLAVIDPKRGEVFFESSAEIRGLKGDLLSLAFYKEGDWEAINQGRDVSFYKENKKATVIPTKVRPYKTQTYDLKKLVKGEVIYNMPTMELFDETYDAKTTKLAGVYLWRANDKAGSKAFVLSPVTAKVNKHAPLTQALKALFAGANAEQESLGYSSSTFGMKFEGVVLKNGIAVVKFSQPAGETNYGSLGPSIFFEAIEKTAKQFPTVKKVEVCAVGDTLIDSQLEKQFPRCAK